MDPTAIPAWKVIGSLWPLYVAILAILWFTGTLGGLASIVAHGVRAVMEFGMNFLARTVALGLGLALVILAVVVFNSVGAPAISSYFPASATTASTAGAQPTAQPGH